MCVLGEPEIRQQHSVLEDRWSPDGGQSGKACFAEKHSNRRSGVTSHLLFSPPTNRKLMQYLFLSSLISCLTGVAYTSECFPCKPGTFSHVPGSSTCEPCPRDTFSGHGASSCTPCNTTTQYAGKRERSVLTHTLRILFLWFDESLEQDYKTALEYSVQLYCYQSCSETLVMEPKNRKREGPIFSNTTATIEEENSLKVQCECCRDHNKELHFGRAAGKLLS